MKHVDVTSFDGEVVATLAIPETPEEVTFEQYVNFSKAMIHFADYLEKTPDPAADEYLTKQVELLCAFFKEEFSVFEDMDFSGATDDQAIEMEKSVISMINYLKGLIESYYNPSLRNAKNYRFKYKGRTFHIPYYRASAYVKDMLKRPNVKVGEAVELLEIARIKDALINEGDDHGSEFFTKGLTNLAILCREPGEDLPEDPAGMKDFIKERVHFFSEINMCIPRDVAFFLKRITMKLSKRQLLGTSSTPGTEREQ